MVKQFDSSVQLGPARVSIRVGPIATHPAVAEASVLLSKFLIPAPGCPTARTFQRTPGVPRGTKIVRPFFAPAWLIHPRRLFYLLFLAGLVCVVQRVGETTPGWGRFSIRLGGFQFHFLTLAPRRPPPIQASASFCFVSLAPMLQPRHIFLRFIFQSGCLAFNVIELFCRIVRAPRSLEYPFFAPRERNVSRAPRFAAALCNSLVQFR